MTFLQPLSGHPICKFQTSPSGRELPPAHHIFDLDGDGAPELFVRGTDGWQALRFKGSLSGISSVDWEDIDFPDVGLSYHGEGLTVGDFNGDGLWDVWKPDPGGPEATIWINTGDRRFTSRSFARPRTALSLGQQEFISPALGPTGVFFDSFSHRGTSVIDYNADGRGDILEQWGKAESWMQGIPPHRYNEVLIANSQVTDVVGQEATDLYFFSEPLGISVGGEFTRKGDVDGDGNPDLFGAFNRVFYGKGAKNNLLRRVEDGLGNFVEVNYLGIGDARDPYEYRPEECQGLKWPETCLKKMTGLVNRHIEGFVDANQEDQRERTYSYTYVNARMNLSGHGWLGFDQRKVTVHVEGMDSAERTVTTLYEPIARYHWGPSAPTSCSPECQPTDAVQPPYVYPLAGLPKVTIIDDHAQPMQSSPLEEAQYDRRTRIEHRWEVISSRFDRPVPRMGFRGTLSFDRERPEFTGGPPLPFEDNGLLHAACFESLGTDDYGNLIFKDERCQDDSTVGGAFVERNLTTATFTPDNESWLISNPELVQVSSFRGGLAASKHQVWSLSYDSRGLLRSVTRDPLGFSSSSDVERRTVTYDRDDFGNVRRVLEEAPGEAARETSIDYDSDDTYARTVTNALGHVTQITFDDNWGTPLTIADPNGRVVQHTYDGLGMLAETHDPEGITLYGYSSALSVESVGAGEIHPRITVTVDRQGTEGTRSGRVVQEIDNYGRPVRSRVEGFAGTEVVSEQTYDKLGRVQSVTAPHLLQETLIPSTTYLYDHLDRVRFVQYSDGTSTERQYASVKTLSSEFEHWLAGITLCNEFSLACAHVGVTRTIDEEGKQNVFITDHRGNIMRTIDGNNVETGAQSSNYSFGGFNQLIQARDNRGFVTSFEYDDYGRLTTRTDPDLDTTGYIYNGFDELTLMNDPSHLVTFYDYDVLGRLTSVVDELGTSEWIYDQGVNALGRVSETRSPGTSENPGGQIVRYTYESNARAMLERLDYVIDGIEYSTTFDYDDLGRTKRILYPRPGTAQRVIAEYLYDTSGNLTGVDETGGASPRPLWRLNEAFQGHLIQRESFGNGASTTYGYHDERRWLEGITTVLGTETIQGITYEHYDNGQLFRRHLASETRTYDYDNLGRLSAVTDTSTTIPLETTTYQYDDIGNIVDRGDRTITYRTDKPHQIAHVLADGSITPTVYEYDQRGNVSRRGVHTFEYTPFNLPKSISQPTALEFKTTHFEYTADAERVVRRDDDQTRHFVPELYQRLIDSNGDTIEERFQLYAGSRQLGEIVRTPGSEQTLYFHADRLGSVDTLSNDIGESFRQDFDPFGEPLDPPGPELTRYGFTGHQHDRDLGVIDMRGRLYDPVAGRFMSADPIIQAPFWSQGLNRYSYVFNDPINLTDPSGFTSLAQGDYDSGIIMGYSAAVPFAAGGSMSIAGGIGGGGFNLLQTVTSPGFGGASPGSGPQEIATPTSNAPTTGQPRQGGMSAVGQNTAPGPAVVQEAAGPKASGPPRPQPPGGDRFLNLPASGDPYDVVFPALPPGAPLPPQAVRAWGEGSRTVLEYENGAREIRAGGSLAWRNYNQGNLRGSPYQIGRAHGFAVFPGEEAGEGALRSLLSNDPYASLTIDQAIGRYAPSFENNTAAYRAAVRSRIGVPGSTRIDQLSNGQFDALVNTIRDIEGWQPGTVTWR